MKLINIHWDTDGEVVDLPRSIELPEWVGTEAELMTGEQREDERDEMLTDWISDEYGWCVEGFDID